MLVSFGHHFKNRIFTSKMVFSQDRSHHSSRPWRPRRPRRDHDDDHDHQQKSGPPVDRLSRSRTFRVRVWVPPPLPLTVNYHFLQRFFARRTHFPSRFPLFRFYFIASFSGSFHLCFFAFWGSFELRIFEGSKKRTIELTLTMS